jgi:hypothetical protein
MEVSYHSRILALSPHVTIYFTVYSHKILDPLVYPYSYPTHRESCENHNTITELCPYKSTVVCSLQPHDPIIFVSGAVSQFIVIELDPKLTFIEFYLYGYMNTQNNSHLSTRNPHIIQKSSNLMSELVFGAPCVQEGRWVLFLHGCN